MTPPCSRTANWSTPSPPRPDSPCPTPASKPTTRERVHEIAASRRRIVEAGDTQRQHLERDLRDGVQQRMSTVAVLLAECPRRHRWTTTALLDGLDDELDRTRTELDDLARGIHPRILTEKGLAAALGELTNASPRCRSDSPCRRRLPPAIEAAVYFLCAEALTNVAKHADATRVAIEITAVDGTIVATIDDDGIMFSSDRC